MNQLEFNQLFKKRTKALAIAIIKLYSSLTKNDEIRIIGKQLIRSGSSTAANYRAVCRGRSTKERFSKMCIVVEEIDETVFWLEVLEESGLAQIPTKLKQEAEEILKVMVISRKKLKQL